MLSFMLVVLTEGFRGQQQQQQHHHHHQQQQQQQVAGYANSLNGL